MKNLEYWLESDKDIIVDIEPPQTLDDEIASANSEQNKSSHSIVWSLMLVYFKPSTSSRTR